MPKLKYILLYHTLFHFATGYAPARTVSPYSENLRYWMTSASRSDVFASLIVMYCADGAKTILYRFHMTFLSVHIVVCRVSTLRLHSTWHTPCSAEKRWQENCRDRSTAVRSRSGSDTAPWCHSRPSLRFATSSTVRFQIDLPHQSHSRCASLGALAPSTPCFVVICRRKNDTQSFLLANIP